MFSDFRLSLAIDLDDDPSNVFALVACVVVEHVYKRVTVAVKTYVLFARFDCIKYMVNVVDAVIAFTLEGDTERAVSEPVDRVSVTALFDGLDGVHFCDCLLNWCTNSIAHWYTNVKYFKILYFFASNIANDMKHTYIINNKILSLAHLLL